MSIQILRLQLLPRCFFNFFTLASLAFVLSACASKPIVDMQGVDRAQYAKDLQACERYQEQVSSTVGERALGAAVVGGMIGALFGGNAGRNAGASAVLGGSSGVLADNNRKEQVTKRCLQNRGYKVLG